MEFTGMVTLSIANCGKLTDMAIDSIARHMINLKTLKAWGMLQVCVRERNKRHLPFCDRLHSCQNGEGVRHTPQVGMCRESSPRSYRKTC